MKKEESPGRRRSSLCAGVEEFAGEAGRSFHAFQAVPAATTGYVQLPDIVAARVCM